MPTTRKHILIDSGTQPAEGSVETYLRDHGVTHIDVMYATHTHADHLGGDVGPSQTSDTDGVVSSFPPSVFLDSPVKNSTASSSFIYADLQRTLTRQAITPVVVRRFDTSASLAALNWDPEVQIHILNSGTPPNYQSADPGGTDINNESIVARFTYGDVSFVIGGDAENAAEASMLGAFAPGALGVSFAKLHHHGLPDASSLTWISTLQPRVAFIPNTAYSWDPPGDLAGAISQSSRRAHDVGADVYVVDDAPALGHSRNSLHPETSTQYNTTFVTDGRSYEVRLEVATQPAPMKPGLNGCIPPDDLPAAARRAAPK
jgi:hypothetical protein